MDVPSHLKSFTIPADINDFIRDIVPNMEIMVSRVPYDSREIINDFCVYILGMATRDNYKLRWKRYDSKAYPNVPYHLWFLVQLKKFSLKYYASPVYILFSDLDKEGVHAEDDIVDSYSGLAYQDPDLIVEAQRLLEGFMKHIDYLATKYPRNVLYREKGKELLNMIINEYSNDDIANHFKVSTQLVSTWKWRLKNEAKRYLESC